MAPSTEDIGYMPYERPPPLTRCQAFRLLLWNPKKKAVLGRNWQSWSGIMLFFLCFYAVLAALFAICMVALLYTLNYDVPRWQQADGAMGDSPGLAFRPMSEDLKYFGSMITYEAANDESVTSWTNRINEFLSPYEVKSDNQVVCDFNKSVPAGKVCEVKLSTFGNCVRENEYGFRKSSPCFFVKLNKIIGWTPVTYESSADCPDAMPDNLKKHIDSLTAEKRKVIWISCAGEKPVDQENIGELKYFPYQGFAAYYYPYMNIENYVSPLVAVQLQRPVRNVLISIECRAWAHNIRYKKANHLERQGYIHLEVVVD